jgi:hypothetical protein
VSSCRRRRSKRKRSSARSSFFVDYCLDDGTPSDEVLSSDDYDSQKCAECKGDVDAEKMSTMR